MEGLKTNIKAELMLQNVQILKTLFIFSFYIWSTLIMLLPLQCLFLISLFDVVKNVFHDIF